MAKVEQTWIGGGEGSLSGAGSLGSDTVGEADRPIAALMVASAQQPGAKCNVGSSGSTSSSPI